MNIKRLQECGTSKIYHEGEFICTEKEQGHTAFLLLQGWAEVKLKGFQNEQRVVANLKPGVIFGEMSLLENKPRNASVVVSTEKAVVLTIDKENFISILKADSEMAFHLLRTLVTRTENCLDELKGINIPFIVSFRRDKMYTQIQNLSLEQFQVIIKEDSEYALKLLKFLSHALAIADEKIAKRGIK